MAFTIYLIIFFFSSYKKGACVFRKTENELICNVLDWTVNNVYRFHNT